jgi:hypothetical protein
MSEAVDTTEIEARLGELLLVGFPGNELTPEIETKLRAIGPAGVIFFAPNFPDASTAGKAVPLGARDPRHAGAPRPARGG